MWKDPPASAGAGASEHDGDHDTDEEEEHARAHRKGPQLRDENGFCYFGPAEKIHAHLDVDLHVPFVPLAPLEELHASSVQHPRFPRMRWLLHTRRVPVMSHADTAQHTETAGGAPEHAKPHCVGIGDAEKTAWLCHHCASHLRSNESRMTPQAWPSMIF